MDTHFDRTISPDVLVSSNGTCQWLPPGRFSTPCPIDISWFPFDDQTCNLTFQSWLYGGNKLNLTYAYETVNEHFLNGEWNLLGKRARAGTVDFLVCFVASDNLAPSCSTKRDISATLSPLTFARHLKSHLFD